MNKNDVRHELLDQWIEAPSLVDVELAATALNGVAVETPLIENAEVNEKLGGRLMVKAETLQRTGSFKFRGAYNRVRSLNTSAQARGVIAYSSGNHAQAVACAARMMSTKSLIVMPADAPANKVSRTRELGADIVMYNRDHETREEVAERLRDEGGYVMVPPNEDRRVLAGAGTVALEIIHQAKARGITLDAVLVPCGGGGLTAATALVFAAQSPTTRVYGVEPELFDDTARSLAAGERLANPKGRMTICDAIMTDMPGELTFSINRNRLSGVVTVDDEEVRDAMKFAFDQVKLVIEPGGAVGLAAVLSKKLSIAGKSIAVIATGGNVDAASFCGTLKEAATSGKPAR